MIKIKIVPQPKVKISSGFSDIVKVKPESSVVVVGGNIFPNYEGEYNVVPKAFNSTTLETKDKRLLDNITVQKVPYYETSNEFGTTIYIADSAGGNLNG